MLKVSFPKYCDHENSLSSATNEQFAFQQIMKDRWINAGHEDDELKPFVEPELDISDQKRIGNHSVLHTVCAVTFCLLPCYMNQLICFAMFGNFSVVSYNSTQYLRNKPAAHLCQEMCNLLGQIKEIILPYNTVLSYPTKHINYMPFFFRYYGGNGIFTRRNSRISQ